jgi:hypothetical protein
MAPPRRAPLRTSRRGQLEESSVFHLDCWTLMGLQVKLGIVRTMKAQKRRVANEESFILIVLTVE